MKLDLKQFQKVSSDSDRTVMQHPKGHKIHVEHSALSEDECKALHSLPFAKMEHKKVAQKMAKGGSVKDQLISAELGQVPQDESPVDMPQGLPDIGSSVADTAGQVAQQIDQTAQPSMEAPGPEAALAQAAGVAPAIRSTGLEQQLSATQGQVVPQQEAFKATEQANKQEAGYQQKVTNAYTDRLAEYKKHWDAWEKDASEHKDINVDRYMNNMSTGSKITTALGMLISGLGGNSGDNNSVIKFINQQVNNDIDAQKKDFEHRDTMLKRYTEAFGNQTEAEKVLAAQHLQITALRLQQIAAKSGNAMVQGNADMAAGKLMQEAADKLGEGAMNHARASMAFSKGPNGQVDPSKKILALPEKEQAEATKELKDQQNLDSVNKSALDSFERVAKLNTIAGRLSSPLQSKKQISALWGPMIDKVTKESTGRVVPITVELFSGLEPAPGDSDDTLKIKRQKFSELLEQGRSAPTLDRYNIPKSQLKLPGEEPVKGADGKMYVKQGNYMVPVKP